MTMMAQAITPALGHFGRIIITITASSGKSGRAAHFPRISHYGENLTAKTRVQLSCRFYSDYLMPASIWRYGIVPSSHGE